MQSGGYDSPTILHATSKLYNSSPYYVEVYNEVTGTLTGACYATVDCIVTDADPPQTFDEYVAFIADYSTALPPSGIEAGSQTRQVFVRPIP